MTIPTILSLSSCQQDHSGKAEPVTLGTLMLEPSIPIFITENQRFFTQNGIDVIFKNYDTGLSALNAMLNGDLDIASAVSEFALVGKAFKNEQIQTIGIIDKNEYTFIVGRKDRGIHSIGDLKGKRIGVIRETMLEFFLGRFLELHGITIEDVTPISLTGNPQCAEAIVSGDVDAVISVPPFINAAKDKLGDKAILFPAQENQPLFSLLICKNEWINQHPETIKRFLNAVKQSEEYLARHPEESKTIIKKKMNLSDNDIAGIWSRNFFSLSFDQSLIMAMNDEARWMISNNLTPEKTVPDFKNNIYLDGLKAVSPAAVNIIK
jgi:NitT/TauT family transport system substrate-binding protein